MKIGELLSKCDKIKSKELSTCISEKNHRFNSTITNQNKELRYYIKINGLDTIEVDTKCSQPYILATILTHFFFASKTSEYSLYNIYPQLYNKVLRFDKYNEIKNSECTSTYDAPITHSNDPSNSLSIYNHSFIDDSCMSGTLWNLSEFETYRNLPFETGIYDLLSEVFFNNAVSAKEIKSL